MCFGLSNLKGKHGSPQDVEEKRRAKEAAKQVKAEAKMKQREEKKAKKTRKRSVVSDSQ